MMKKYCFTKSNFLYLLDASRPPRATPGHRWDTLGRSTEPYAMDQIFVDFDDSVLETSEISKSSKILNPQNLENEEFLSRDFF